MYPVNWILKTLVVFHLFHFSISIDTITSNHSVNDGDFIVSSRKDFALGFFSPGASSKRYVGIWYYQVSEKTIVWVANRNNPINDTSGVLSINSNGNLVLFERNQTGPVWSTNVSKTSVRTTIAQLLDSGNLVLVQNDAKEKLLWQSFDYPTNTMLPFMKLGLDRRTGLHRLLMPWKSPDDPASGNFSYKIDDGGFHELSSYKNTAKWWRTGSWTGQRWSGVPEMTDRYIFNSTYVENEDEVSIMFGVTKPSLITRMMCSEIGFHQLFIWSNQDHRWILVWSAPKEPCDY